MYQEYHVDQLINVLHSRTLAAFSTRKLMVDNNIESIILLVQVHLKEKKQLIGKLSNNT